MIIFFHMSHLHGKEIASFAYSINMFVHTPGGTECDTVKRKNALAELLGYQLIEGESGCLNDDGCFAFLKCWSHSAVCAVSRRVTLPQDRVR